MVCVNLISGVVRFNLIMLKLLILLGVLSSSWATRKGSLVFPPVTFDFPPPVEVRQQSARNVFQSWMEMPVDHFDPQNRNTFQMRFMFNEDFFGGEGSPIFIMAGGEWAIAPGWLRSGNMFEAARENNGYLVYTEHRYYGETFPYRNLTTENLRYLNVDQALADLAYFIRNMKKSDRFAKSEVVLYGGSYAGNMVLWFKQRYPHLVKGVVASSAPILGKVDFTGYLEVVHEAFKLEGGEECIGHIRRGLEETIEAMNTEAGRRQLEKDYRLCEPLDYDDRFTMGYFSGLISWTFSSSVQQAVPGSLLSVCRNFTSNSYGTTPMEKIGGYIATIRSLTSCWNIRYEDYIASYSRTDLEDYNTATMRAWYYQTCTEYGYFQTAPRIGTAFDVLKWLTVEFYVDMCKQAYDQRFDEEFVYAAVERVNNVFGGLAPDVNNTINVHGYIDPWRALGVYDDHLKDSSPTITVSRASHCFDMRQWLRSDTILMTHAQQSIRQIITSWLN